MICLAPASAAPSFSFGASTSTTATSSTSALAPAPAVPSLFGAKPASTPSSSTGALTFGAKPPATTSTSLGAPAASTSTTTAPTPSMLRGKTLDEIVSGWSNELEERTRDFADVAGDVREWDRVLRENGEQVNNKTLFFETREPRHSPDFYSPLDLATIQLSPTSFATTESNHFFPRLHRIATERSLGCFGQLRERDRWTRGSKCDWRRMERWKWRWRRRTRTGESVSSLFPPDHPISRIDTFIRFHQLQPRYLTLILPRYYFDFPHIAHPDPQRLVSLLLFLRQRRRCLFL